MKSLVKIAVASGLIAIGIIGCGGGGGETPSAPTTTTKAYEGAISAGDFVQAHFDTKTNKLDFNMSGQFADAHNIHNGSYTLTKLFGNFYKYGDLNGNGGLLFFGSNNLSIAHVELPDGTEFNFATLGDIDTPKADDLNGKTFNAGVFLNGESPAICKIAFSATTVNLGPCIGDPTVRNYGWSISDKKILFKSNGVTVAQGIFKKGVKRDTLIMDLINISGYSGIAIGLENKALDAAEVGSGSVFKAMDVAANDISFGEAKIVNDNGQVKVSCKDFDEKGNVEDTCEISLELNPIMSNGSQWSGIAKVSNSASEFALFSKDDGFYLSIDTNPDPNDFIFSFGSNKELQ